MTKFYYWAETQALAERHGLDAELVVALVLQESAGKTHAYRFEPKFFARYLAHKPEWDGAIPERVSASYGLCQVMFPTAVALGYPMSDPPEYLFVPTIGLEYGCRALADCLRWAKGDTAAALASYNGGKTPNNGPRVMPKRNQAYVDKVLRWLAQVRTGEVTG